MGYFNIPLEEKQSALCELASMQEWIADRGWNPSSSASLSVRVGPYTPDSFHFAVTSSSQAEYHPSSPSGNSLLVNASGEPCEATNLQPCNDALIHAKIYRMTGCGAIIHAHTVYNNIVSEHHGDKGFVPVRGTEMIKELGYWEENAGVRIPVLPNFADVTAIVKLIPTVLNPDVPGILLRNHGIYVWGNNALETMRRLEAFEFMFEVEYRRMLLSSFGPSEQ